jgi:hypothetical protein
LGGGAERLALGWKASIGQLIDRRGGVPIEPMDAKFNDLLHKSGSASYKLRITENMTMHEFLNLSRDV